MMIGAPPNPATRITKNRSSALRIWGITLGGKFFGFASGVIAGPLLATMSASLILVSAIVVYNVYHPNEGPVILTGGSPPKGVEKVVSNTIDRQADQRHQTQDSQFSRRRRRVPNR
jgi:hypothetical protein